jgi:cytochrome b subunit of formate dehydrogenase
MATSTGTKSDKIEIDLSDLVTSDDKRFIRARRYSKFHFTQHWGNMILMVLFFITGLEIAFSKYVFGDYQFTQNFHIIIAYIILFWSLGFYAFVVYWDKKLYEVILTPRDILDLLLIIGCAIGLLNDKHYPHYDFYDPIRKRYIMKYHPVQKMLAFFNFWALIFIGITGFALYEQINPGRYFMAELGALVMSPFTSFIDDIGLNIRFIHYLVFIYFGLGTAIHAYFALKKDNRSRFVAMFKSYEHIELEDDPSIKYVSLLDDYYKTPLNVEEPEELIAEEVTPIEGDKVEPIKVDEVEQIKVDEEESESINIEDNEK